jgi:hypothetical protein
MNEFSRIPKQCGMPVIRLLETFATVGHAEKISMTTAVSRMNVLFFFCLQTVQIADSQYFTMNIPLQLRTLPTALNYSLIFC